ncbi:SET and MYND domain-containing protein 4 isoform X2 [Vitis riparia]|uniref:SET and MYND domain-containing protein 4 isoform X2 n=1 Tax=Vitis riparia TaxID=96939 RepID=UPI00155B3C3B|nr:SET and MYND domain-containing protein 4 isoform X2 [Vitis riparia]
MEKLKSLVPDALKRMIAESTPDDLPSTCHSLLEFFLHMQQFQMIVGDLAHSETALCCKNRDAALESKRKGNECFSSGDYMKALSLYSQALRVAPTDADDVGKNLVVTLFVNRASVLHAWYRRGKANASLNGYEDAVRDLNVAMHLEESLGGRSQIERELKLILDQYKGNNSVDQHDQNDLGTLEEQLQIKLQCVSTPTKGRGMASLSEISQSYLVHTEEPYAAIILKHCRDTHCHFCFNELPVDSVPCTSCSIPLYCSQHCQMQAGGQELRNNSKNHGICTNLSSDLEKYVAGITLPKDSDSNIEWIVEHKHECKGVNWPAVLPPEIVLAGRVMVKSVEQKKHSCNASNLMDTLELSHSYKTMAPESKLDLHIYSIVLLYCLQHSHGFELPLNGISISQLIILISQIKVNSIAIVRMKFMDGYSPLDQSVNFSPAGGAFTSNMEQVRVGQAIYSVASLFNHSCQPNIHAYFLSRTLFLRATEHVAVGCPLELSYGPQVGQWDCKDRQKFLKDEYSFRCECSGCSELNVSDLVLNAFRCVNPDCFGTVLDSCVIKYENEKFERFQGVPQDCISEPHLQLKNDGIREVAHQAFANSSFHAAPGYCLHCGAYRDLEASHATVREAGIYISRLQEAIVSKEVPATTFSDALRSLDLLKSTLHAYNKGIAEAEDWIAQAFCMIGELQPAMYHCKASIEILEKLYGSNHIVIGYELMKLSSIQLSLGDTAAMKSISRLAAIFSWYYGPHADMMFPYLGSLQRETCKLVL